jgi:hypothetical protein
MTKMVHLKNNYFKFINKSIENEMKYLKTSIEEDSLLEEYGGTVPFSTV